MPIPKDLTHAEAGALLVAVGQHMVDHDVCAGAAMADDFIKNLEHSQPLINSLRDAHWPSDLTQERAEEILLHLTLSEAIEFVEPHYLEPKS